MLLFQININIRYIMYHHLANQKIDQEDDPIYEQPNEISIQQPKQQQSSLMKILFISIILIVTLFLTQHSLKPLEVSQSSPVLTNNEQSAIKVVENDNTISTKNAQHSQDDKLSQIQFGQFANNSFHLGDNNTKNLQQIIKIVAPTRAHWYSMKSPSKYILNDNQQNLAQNIQQLPLCIYSHNLTDRAHLQQIRNSLINIYNKQQYRNFKHFYSTLSLSSSISSPNQPFPSVHIELRSDEYNPNLLFRSAILQNCPQKSIIVLMNNPLKKGSLRVINLLYQLENIWVTYHAQNNQNLGNSQSNKQVVSSISSFHIQIIKNIPISAISRFYSLGFISLAATFLKLAKYHAQSLPIHYMYEQIRHSNSIDYLKQAINEKTTTFVSNPMMYLEPNRDSEKQVNYYWQKITGGKAKQPKYNERNQIKLSQMLRSIQYFSLKKLPNSHMLNKRELQDYENKYHLSKYQQQLPFCLIIPSRNNIDDGRYRKVLDTVIMQNYSNYHIIFIDDGSTDETFQQTESYLSKLGLRNRTKLIKNSKQMFATYNIQNAINNQCKSHQIVVLLDGDDQLIGKQVFRLINNAYQKKQNWIVYFTLISNIYMYGVSKVLTDDMFDQSRPRQRMHVIGALRTFYVDIYRKIHDKDHKNKNGEYLDSLYDDAMQFPMMEMSGKQHIQYIPEIVYFYNQNYGHNDASTPASQRQRQKNLQDILQRSKYERLTKLFDQ